MTQDEIAAEAARVSEGLYFNPTQLADGRICALCPMTFGKTRLVAWKPGDITIDGW